jgi:hypothetical protein
VLRLKRKNCFKITDPTPRVCVKISCSIWLDCITNLPNNNKPNNQTKMRQIAKCYISYSFVSRKYIIFAAQIIFQKLLYVPATHATLLIPLWLLRHWALDRTTCWMTWALWGCSLKRSVCETYGYMLKPMMEMYSTTETRTGWSVMLWYISEMETMVL